jgi:hypothetical protein
MATLPPVKDGYYWVAAAAAAKEWWLKHWIGGLRVVMEPGTNGGGVEGVVDSVICGKVNTYCFRPSKGSALEGTGK